jgi:beta-galactosidase/beta-glucuronidase
VDEATAPTEHPQPLLRRPWRSLDGTWEFALDASGVESPDAVRFDRRILVPFAPETSASGIGLSTRSARCWYRQRIAVEPAQADERLLLHFGAVDRTATVYAGGRFVGSHTGGYTPFAVDVTAAAASGELDVVVAVEDDADDHDAPRGKQEWREQPHEIWYPRTTGIWRTVWLERVPQARVAELTWTSDAAAMTVTLHARLVGPLPPGARLHVRLSAGRRLLVDDSTAVATGTVQRTWSIGDGGYDDRVGLVWSPDSPVLIDAVIALLGSRGEVVDLVESYTALRTVKIADGRLLLNGHPVPLRLVLDQGYWPATGATPPSTQALRRDLELTRALGFNGARKHQKTEDPRYLAAADQLGVLVWAELPSAYRPGSSSATNLLHEWTDLVQSHRGHPSVVTWVPVNESWGVPAAEHDPRQRALIEALTAAARALDGTRPVSANDGWETTGGDVVGVHDYAQDPTVLRARYGDAAAVDRHLQGRRWDGRLADLDRRGADGRAVVLSEFGGIALGGEGVVSAWGYDRARDGADLATRYRELWAAVHDSTGLAGACWTQLTDTYQEVNGLLHADRTPKADLEELRAATMGLPRVPRQRAGRSSARGRSAPRTATGSAG